MAKGRAPQGTTGRPTKVEQWLTPAGLLEIFKLSKTGVNERIIAKNMGIAYSTLERWKSNYTDIRGAIQDGRAAADAKVESALFKRATGYKAEEVTEIDGKVVKRVFKDVPPDTTAQTFWLKNRRPEEWRDRQEVSHNLDSFKVNITVDDG